MAATCSLSPVDALAHFKDPQADAVIFHPDDPDVIIVRMNYGLIVTRDGGDSWGWICSEVMEYSHDDGISPSFALMADGTLLAASQFGLWRGSASGCVWNEPDQPLSRKRPVAVVPSGNGAVVITSRPGADNGLFLSDDAGETWSAVGETVDDALFDHLTVAPSNSSRLFASATLPVTQSRQEAESRLFASDDQGKTWNITPLTRTADTSRFSFLAVHPSDEKRVLIREYDALKGTTLAVWASDDAGATVVKVATLDGNNVLAAAYSSDGQTLFVSGDGGMGLLRSNDELDTVSKVPESDDSYCLHVRSTPSGDELWRCAKGLVGEYDVGVSTDGGQSFRGAMEFSDVTGAVACDADTKVANLCLANLTLLDGGNGVFSTLDGGVVSSPAKKKSPSSGCHVSEARTDGGRGSLALAFLALAMLRYRRSR